MTSNLILIVKSMSTAVIEIKNDIAFGFLNQLERMNIRNLLLILTLFQFSCSQKSSNWGTELVFEFSEMIEHQKLNIDSSVICGFALDMEIIDSLLVVEDFLMQDNAINVYNVHSGEVVYRLGFTGRGPGEIVDPSFNISTSENIIQLFEPNLKKLIEYYLINNDTPRISEYYIPYSKINGFVMEVVKVNDHFICMGKNQDFDFNRFIVLDTLYNIEYGTGKYPELVEKLSISEIQDILYYVCHIALKPDKKRVAFGSYIGAVLEIFDISGIEENIKNINTIKIYPPIFKFTNRLIWYDETIIGFEDLFATDNFIYALLNGSIGSEYQYPKSICVFDWNGNPIKRYITDVPLRSFAVDEPSKVIFAVTHPDNDNPEFVYFNIM